MGTTLVNNSEALPYEELLSALIQELEKDPRSFLWKILFKNSVKILFNSSY
ncbi:15477_t:CDS:2 [Dentiscutata heterogama]|uniref:15477_t:CDS:1 n=1 Tax=Dentiscutata heterogama TaxID=1316150 RepID=A0ACA9LEP7_9GLOM|nr:15477_t:CDS:2 [Dentiscutata heterogama]